MKVQFNGASNAFELNSITIADPFLPFVVSTTKSNTAPTMSNSDLAQTQYLSSSATGGEEASSHATLFNGSIGNGDGDTNDSGEVRLNSGNTVTVNFDTFRQQRWIRSHGDYHLLWMEYCCRWGVPIRVTLLFWAMSTGAVKLLLDLSIGNQIILLHSGLQYRLLQERLAFSRVG